MTTTNNDYFKPVKPLDGWFSIVVGLELMGGYSDCWLILQGVIEGVE